MSAHLFSSITGTNTVALGELTCSCAFCVGVRPLLDGRGFGAESRRCRLAHRSCERHAAQACGAGALRYEVRDYPSYGVARVQMGDESSSSALVRVPASPLPLFYAAQIMCIWCFLWHTHNVHRNPNSCAPMSAATSAPTCAC